MVVRPPYPQQSDCLCHLIIKLLLNFAFPYDVIRTNWKSCLSKKFRPHYRRADACGPSAADQWTLTFTLLFIAVNKNIHYLFGTLKHTNWYLLSNILTEKINTWREYRLVRKPIDNLILSSPSAGSI